MIVLVLNCGSSSVKFQLLDVKPQVAGTDRTLARGLVENIGGSAVIKYEADGRKVKETAEILEHKIAVERSLELLTRPDVGVLKQRSEIEAVGHRVVHGGERFKTSVRIDDDVLDGIEDCFELAPLHNPPNVKGYRAAREAKVAAIVVGGMHYRDIKEILGYELGVAITGHEKLGTTVVVTEGFGEIAMAGGTHALLGKLEGELAAANGATQIRAGVIRPEVVVPIGKRPAGAETAVEEMAITVGSLIRVIRAPWFGRLATVVELPSELEKMESETMVRVLRARFVDGAEAVLPRSNVERIEKS